ncbi:hypothetical protein [Streptomyces sp. SLBN-118]|uniref:hypothetical protein n=1 Tax=Streptomyces sp. SLBN-118 TaxID=2768454 RepID=UPI00135C6E63|nr:hypothetical protein [Streptomyces sp. SLBN-118]
MSWQPQHGNGAYDAGGTNGVYHAEQANLADGALGVYAGNGAYQDCGDTQGLPLVAPLYGDSPPAYDGYVYPAAGHGWQESATTGQGVSPGEAFGRPPEAYDRHDAYGGGHDTQEGGFGPHETDRGTYGFEHDHIYRDAGHAHGANNGQVDAGQADGSVFVDASGRRSRLIRRAALGVAAVCVVFIAVVIAGFFSPVPSGGVLPWSQKQEPEREQGQKQEGSTTATGQPGSTDRPTGGPSATPGESAAPNPSLSVSATKTDGATTAAPTKAPTTTAAPTTSAPGQGNSGDHPGGGQGSTSGQGSTRGPK